MNCEPSVAQLGESVRFRNPPEHGRRFAEGVERTHSGLANDASNTSSPNNVYRFNDLEEGQDCYNKTDNDSDNPEVRTFVRSEAPQHLVRALSNACTGGVTLDVTLLSVICCGGGVLKGSLMLRYDPKAKSNQATQVESIQLDCIGVESVKGHEPKMFFSIAQDVLNSKTYLYDLHNTFPQEEYVMDRECIIPFGIQMPLDVGPGHFSSERAEIDYTLFVTVGLTNYRRFPRGRTLLASRKIKLFSCLDPEKALLPSAAPIDAVEEGKIRFGGKHTLKVAARIHRPSWIAGQRAFVDVSLTNDSARTIRRIQMDLVRTIAFYESAAAKSAFQSVDYRLPEKTDVKIISTSLLAVDSDKSDNTEWKGVKAGSRETTVCGIAIPAGELSITAGRYFATQYLIRVTTGPKCTTVKLDLPIVVYHMNSLDVLPSSIKSVSRMIEAYSSGNSPTKLAKSSTGVSRRSSMPNPISPDLSPVLEHAQDVASFPVSRLEGSQSSALKSMTTKGGQFKTFTTVDNSNAPVRDLAATKPGIQCDLRRALSLDYQSRFSKLNLSPENASYTQGAPLADRPLGRKRKDLTENLAHRLHREQVRHPSFYDVV